MVHDQSARGLINIAGRAGEADLYDIAAFPPLKFLRADLQMGLAGEKRPGLDKDKAPHAKRGGKRQTEGLHAQDLD